MSWIGTVQGQCWVAIVHQLGLASRKATNQHRGLFVHRQHGAGASRAQQCFAKFNHETQTAVMGLNEVAAANEDD
jgi:hypothetical protein